MSSTFNPYESALLAVLSEFSKSGGDIDDLLKRVESGVLGNAVYVNVGAEFKTSIIEALRQSANESKHFSSL